MREGVPIKRRSAESIVEIHRKALAIALGMTCSSHKEFMEKNFEGLKIAGALTEDERERYMSDIDNVTEAMKIMLIADHFRPPVKPRQVMAKRPQKRATSGLGRAFIAESGERYYAKKLENSNDTIIMASNGMVIGRYTSYYDNGQTIRKYAAFTNQNQEAGNYPKAKNARAALVSLWENEN